MLSQIFGHRVDLSILIEGVRWNILLAIIPVVLGYAASGLYGNQRVQNRLPAELGAALLFGAWLAFVPNTIYLLTEWRHFLNSFANPDLYKLPNQNRDLGLTAQIGFYALYSGAGILCFELAIRPIERIARTWKVPFPLLAPVLFLLISLGVYLGLIYRLNSWDVITHPAAVLATLNRTVHRPALMMALLAFALFLWALYEALDLWMDGLAATIASWRGRGSSQARPKGGKSPKTAPGKARRGP